MVVAHRWTGREAAALRRAQRMSIRGFAAHLGVAVATVSNWDSRGEQAQLRTETQQLLDIDLARASADVHQRFAAILADDSRTAEAQSFSRPAADAIGVWGTQGRTKAITPSLNGEDDDLRTHVVAAMNEAHRYFDHEVTGFSGDS